MNRFLLPEVCLHFNTINVTESQIAFKCDTLPCGDLVANWKHLGYMTVKLDSRHRPHMHLAEADNTSFRTGVYINVQTGTTKHCE